MSPAQLTAESFQSYPSHARQIALDALPLLQSLPLAFTPFLLKEIIGSEAKFPAEQRELTSQLAYLTAMNPSDRLQEMKPFASLTLKPSLENFDWVNSPAQFLEQLSAHLWATHQMDTFRAASEVYIQKFHATLTPEPLPIPRATVAVIGQGVTDKVAYPLFVKLGRQGTVFTNVSGNAGIAALHDALEQRARTHPVPYGHWCIDGGYAPALKGYSNVGYQELGPARAALASTMLAAYEAKPFDPEALRTKLARSTYESLGVKASGDPTLDAFTLSLLTEGSGTQIYSTTFVQWAAREALRRAQPITLYTRYAPRQRERSMDELLAGTKSANVETDAMGSLIDGDMGAYYTWLNQERLHGADQARFLAWFENHQQAVLISPADKHGFVDHSPVELSALAQKVLLA